MAMASERLGLVEIGLAGGADDLRIRLSAESTPAAAALSGEAPRLAAELAAQGYRLHSLDFASRGDGGGALPATMLAGGAAGGEQRHAPGSEPRPAPAALPAPAPVADTPAPSRRAASSPTDRYA